MHNILSGEFKGYIVTAPFDDDTTEITLQLLPPVLGALWRKVTAAVLLKVPLAPWLDQESSKPDDWAMSSPALDTLYLIHHSLKSAHKLLRNTRCMFTGRCRHWGISLEDILKKVWQVKENTPERRARYSKDWRNWGEKRLPNNKHVDAMIMTMYPDVCFTNKDARIYRQMHGLRSTRIVASLSKPKG